MTKKKMIKFKELMKANDLKLAELQKMEIEIFIDLIQSLSREEAIIFIVDGGHLILSSESEEEFIENFSGMFGENGLTTILNELGEEKKKSTKKADQPFPEKAFVIVDGKKYDAVY